jgi:hypothetical protein
MDKFPESFSEKYAVSVLRADEGDVTKNLARARWVIFNRYEESLKQGKRLFFITRPDLQGLPESTVDTLITEVTEKFSQVFCNKWSSQEHKNIMVPLSESSDHKYPQRSYRADFASYVVVLDGNPVY